MRNSFSVAALCLLTVFLAGGCSTVTTPYPLSAAPTAIDKEKLEGLWLAGDDAFYVKFASNGVAQIAGIEWRNDRFQLVRGEMIVVPARTNNFLSVRFQENGAWTNEYHIARYAVTREGDLVVWTPDVKAFQDAVATNALQGVVDAQQYSTHILLTNSPAAILEYIDDPKNMMLFDYRNPLVIERLDKPRETEK